MAKNDADSEDKVAESGPTAVGLPELTLSTQWLV